MALCDSEGVAIELSVAWAVGEEEGSAEAVPGGEAEGDAEAEAPPEGELLSDGDKDAEALWVVEPVGTRAVPVLQAEALGVEVGQGGGVPLAAAEAVALPSAEPLMGALPVPLPEGLPLSAVPRALPLGLPREEGVDVPLWVPMALAVEAPPLPVPFALPLAEALPPPPPSAVVVGVVAPLPEGLVRGEGVPGAPLGVVASL